MSGRRVRGMDGLVGRWLLVALLLLAVAPSLADDSNLLSVGMMSPMGAALLFRNTLDCVSHANEDTLQHTTLRECMPSMFGGENKVDLRTSLKSATERFRQAMNATELLPGMQGPGQDISKQIDAMQQYIAGANITAEGAFCNMWWGARTVQDMYNTVARSNPFVTAVAGGFVVPLADTMNGVPNFAKGYVDDNCRDFNKRNYSTISGYLTDTFGNNTYTKTVEGWVKPFDNYVTQQAQNQKAEDQSNPFYQIMNMFNGQAGGNNNNNNGGNNGNNVLGNGLLANYFNTLAGGNANTNTGSNTNTNANQGNSGGAAAASGIASGAPVTSDSLTDILYGNGTNWVTRIAKQLRRSSPAPVTPRALRFIDNAATALRQALNDTPIATTPAPPVPGFFDTVQSALANATAAIEQASNDNSSLANVFGDFFTLNNTDNVPTPLITAVEQLINNVTAQANLTQADFPAILNNTIGGVNTTLARLQETFRQGPILTFFQNLFGAPSPSPSPSPVPSPDNTLVASDELSTLSGIFDVPLNMTA